MERVLVFNGETAQAKFDKVWEGFVSGSYTEQARRRVNNIPACGEEQRRRANITRKLKKASEEDGRVIANNIKYRKIAEGTELVFTQPEHELLVKTVTCAEWNPELLDDVYDVIDWLEAADKREA